MANPAEEIKVKKDNMTITVTKKAFHSYYSLVGYKEVKSRRTTSDKSE
ncbi:TPA: hypothetical protein ACPFIO_002235 [Staphylococcus aureus]|uniref:Uncharacterized protein n=1 Tax=Staphylococcus aureus TaxID=1280 RepID=A0A6G4Q2D1_STAAU|nr:hypothetical protein [Staphylococcus aureus]MBB2550321.1 hypothetical protein [Staphylococcus aureus]MBG3248444.1 hypothetical protein [Staphylococcus aureus]MBO8525604.1 hypothetical protein [Staphylococcus aureus]MBU7868855.1 hypothetical protein [Staphylococcus aureus]MBY0909912.1 hypothetical protein [Staphylococcus aureus]